jgi:GDPmannose 4,6-dehydratase
MKTALITGITGKGYVVHGVIRRSSSFNTGRIDHLYRDRHEKGVKLHLHYGDMLDGVSLRRILTKAAPDEVYNLAAQSHVRTSFDQPIYTAETIAIGSLQLLEAIRDYRDQTHNDVRLYQASSSEMFGSSAPPQNEDTPFRPRSPYACAKVQAFWQTVNYREAYGLFACNGILFNHESPRRGETFVTRKITRAATRIKMGLQNWLFLGNLAAKRDWGYAPEYVQAIWLMLQQDKPDDFVIATGKMHPVGHFANLAFSRMGLKPGDYIRHDARYERPTEVDELRGDATKAKQVLDWEPKTTIDGLCWLMIDADMKFAERELLTEAVA